MMRFFRRMLTAGATLTLLLLLLPGVASAQTYDGSGIPQGSDVGVSLNLLWIVVGAALVIFMQAGFAMVETGFCRARHAAHVVSTNFAIFGLGFVAFFLLGFPLMFGGYSFPGYFGFDAALGTPLIGAGSWVFLWQGGWLLDLDPVTLAPVAAFFLYMVAFMDTTATIPTGSMAERWRWKAFVGWGLFCGAIYYPLFGAWTWGGGWLSQLGNSLHLGFGYVDFAGSGIVHAMGGAAALAGALVLGPRIGKFSRDGRPNALPGHNIPMAMLGTFILLFGWFGFNAASTLAASDVRFAVAAVNTGIAAAFGATACMFYVTRRMGKPDPSMLANGMLAGLVAITAPCAFVEPWAAAVIGCIAGVLVVESIFFFEKRGIDDPVGAISVHGVNGLWGVLSIGIFASGRYGAGWNLTDTSATAGRGVTGLLYNPSLGLAQLGAQLVGCVVIAVVMTAVAYTFFKLQDSMMSGGIRTTVEEELEGLDLREMGVEAYPDDHEYGLADVVAEQLPPQLRASAKTSTPPVSTS